VNSKDGKEFLLLLGVSLFTIFFDQATKFIIQRMSELFSSFPVIDDIFRITYIQNPNALFGLPLGSHPLFVPFSLLITAILLFLFFRLKGRHLLTRLGLALILGGAIGNLLDRFRLGAVIDFIDIGYRGVRWPIFNLADAAVTIGIALLILENFRKEG